MYVYIQSRVATVLQFTTLSPFIEYKLTCFSKNNFYHEFLLCCMGPGASAHSPEFYMIFKLLYTMLFMIVNLDIKSLSTE